MIKRIVEISNPGYLKLKNKQLIIEQEGHVSATIAIEDIAILILNHYAIALTQPVVIECQKNNVAMIFCDEKHLPYSLVLPLADANTLHQKVLQLQIKAKKSTKAKIWQGLVREKIQNQAYTLAMFDKPHQRLLKLAKQVKLADNANAESIAAQIYWKSLFGKLFIRDRKQEGINALLNYGYSLLRSMVARSICASGLHPALSVFHKNQYNSLALADDFIEPFRPIVDAKVFELVCQNTNELDKNAKIELIKLTALQVKYQKRKVALMVAMSYILADFKRMLAGEIRQVHYPKIPKTYL